MTRMAVMAATLVALASPVVIAALAVPARADEAISRCFAKEGDGRVEACTTLLEGSSLQPSQRVDVHAMRGIAYALKGDYAPAIRDYSVAIEKRPGFVAAINNRAWAYFRSGQVAAALA